ncbi:hypothetical protein DFP73DRAFT_598178 [Morchella snyderi]|nr:hypothetical protein DFP73DRAFT_598178 [Morchella snyderi]
MIPGPVRAAYRGRSVPFEQKFIDRYACGCVDIYWDREIIWIPDVHDSIPEERLIGETRERGMVDRCHKCDSEEYYRLVQSANLEVSNWRQKLKILDEGENKEGQPVDPNTIPPSPENSDPPSSPLIPRIDGSTPMGDTGSNHHRRTIAFGSFPAQEFPVRSGGDVGMPLVVAPRNSVLEETPAVVTTSNPDETIVSNIILPVITPKKLTYADVLKRKTITPRLECTEASLVPETPVLGCVKPVKPPFRQKLVFKGRAPASGELSTSKIIPAKANASHDAANSRAGISLRGTHGLSSSKFVKDGLSDRIPFLQGPQHRKPGEPSA